MPLSKSNVSIQLAAGVDTKTDPKQVVAGKLLMLENGIFTSKNRIKKRNGYGAFGQQTMTNATVLTGSGLATYKQELLEFDGKKLYSYDAAKDNWLDKGSFTSVSLKQTSVVRNTFQQTQADSDYSTAGLAGYAWEDSGGGCRYSVIDVETGLAIVSSALLDATASRPQVVAFGNYIAFFYVIEGSNSLHMKTVSVASPQSISADILLTTDLTASFVYSVCRMQDRVFIAWSGATFLTVTYFTANMVAGTIYNMTALSATVHSMDLTGRPDGAYLFMGYCSATGVAGRLLDYNLTFEYLGAGIEFVIEGVTAYNITAAFTTNLAFQVLYDTAADTIRKNNVVLVDPVSGNDGTATSATAAEIFRSVRLYSHAFSWDGRVFAMLSHASTLQDGYFVGDTAGNIVAKLNMGLGGGHRATQKPLATVSLINGSQFVTAIGTKDYLEAKQGTIFTQTGIDMSVLDFAKPQESYWHAELAKDLHIGGGFVWMYDGSTPVEHGFHLYPEGVTGSSAQMTGTITGSQYVATYEWMDNVGNTHRSAPSPVFEIHADQEISGSVAVTMSVPTLRLTAKKNTRSPVQICLYRTLGQGSTFYKVTSSLNDTTVDTVTIIDNHPDSSIIGNNILYTTGGEVENIAPNAIVNMTVYANRIVALDAANRLVLWYSKQVIPGVPVEFSDLFTINVDPRGGDCTSVNTLDDKLIVFKENSIFYITGQGPTPSGDQNDFNSGILISTDGGCIDPRSVVLTPQGLMFKSHKGIYLLDRSLQTSYIGADVEAYNSANITACDLIPNTTQVRFTLDTGVALVWDYYFSQWGVFTNINANDSVIFQGQHTFVTPGGQVRTETPGVFADNGQVIKLRISTSWLSFAQLQGYQRAYALWILGEYLGQHNLQTTISYDFIDTGAQVNSIDAATLLRVTAYGEDSPYGSEAVYGGTAPLYMWGINLRQQKCTAVRVTIEDVQPSPNEGLSLSVLSFEVGTKKGLSRLPPWKTFG